MGEIIDHVIGPDAQFAQRNVAGDIGFDELDIAIVRQFGPDDIGNDDFMPVCDKAWRQMSPDKTIATENYVSH
jgi:hypothetical protein